MIHHMNDLSNIIENPSCIFYHFPLKSYRYLHFFFLFLDFHVQNKDSVKNK